MFKEFLSDFGVSGASIWCERGCKNQPFIEVEILLILMSKFEVFLEGLGALFMILDVPETGLKLNDLSWLPSGIPRLRQHAQGVVTGCFLGRTPPSRMLAALYKRRKTTSSMQE